MKVYPQENLELIVFRLKEDNRVPVIYSTPMLVGYLATPKTYQDVRLDSILSEQFHHTTLVTNGKKIKSSFIKREPSFA